MVNSQISRVRSASALAVGLFLALGATTALTSSLGCAPAPITLKVIGDTCATDADCGQMMCRYGTCTKSCTQQGDCPKGSDCGLQKPEDGVTGGLGATCYKTAHDTTGADKGGWGADCAVYSPDPATGLACDKSLTKSPCADGFTCHAGLRCDPLAFCTKACTGDTDCPPSFFCSMKTGTKPCTADADCTSPGATCQVPPGGTDAFKLCISPGYCARRTQCSDCGVADQCQAGYSCSVDQGGNHFCGKLCDSDEQCPQPEGAAGSMPTSANFQSCVDAGNGSGKKVCRPTAGFCKGPSAIKEQAGKSNTVCSPCRPGVPSDCPAGFCYAGEFSIESFCTIPCTAKATRGRVDYTLTEDTCPTGMHCYGGGCQGATCNVTGLCTGDINPEPMLQTTYGALTCYPY